MSVSMVDGHIDPDGATTPQQAIKYFEDEISMLENAPNLNGCEMRREWREQLEICKMAKQAIEKQILKKVKYKNRHGDGKDYYNKDYFNCPCCGRRLRNKQKDAHCGKCGQLLDWSDTE